MEDDERQRKIEAGKLKLAEFKKKRHKIKTKNAVANPTPSTSTGSINLQNADKKNDSSKDSCIENLAMKTESKVPAIDEMNIIIATESSLQLSEGSDDASHLVNADSELLSLFDQKIKRYQSAMHHKDNIIQKLSDRLASTMSAHAANSAGNEEVRILQEEINLLHQQMKEYAPDQVFPHQCGGRYQSLLYVRNCSGCLIIKQELRTAVLNPLSVTGMYTCPAQLVRLVPQNFVLPKDDFLHCVALIKTSPMALEYYKMTLKVLLKNLLILVKRLEKEFERIYCRKEEIFS
ncbi:PACT_coil_coil domain-containing protein [Trichonephila clavipes]|nr:PACT_coil_coil domain-containing protein [Trichonephila clavipes]